MSSEASGSSRASGEERQPVGLADTSIFIARELERPLKPLPSRLAVSVVTIGELQLGALAATDRASRARRARTLAIARRSDPIPISEAVMNRWAHLVRTCQLAGISRTTKGMDALLAATAIEHGLAVVTQDNDFDLISEAEPALDVIRV